MKDIKVTLTNDDISNMFQRTVDVKATWSEDEFKATLFSGSKGIQKMKAKDLKEIIKYLKEVKGIPLKLSGNKSELADRIINSISLGHTSQHTMVPSSSYRFGSFGSMQNPSGNLFNFGNQNPANSLSSWVLSNNNNLDNNRNMAILKLMNNQADFQKTNSIQSRRKTMTEERQMNTIMGDMTIGGRVDPFFAIRDVLDVVNIKSGKTLLHVSLKPLQHKDVKNHFYNIHLYNMSQRLKPKNWVRGTSIFFNGEEFETPPENRKLKKQPSSKKLICYSPIIIPHYKITSKNRLEININGINKVDDLLLICIVLTRKTEELVNIVLNRKTVNELKKQSVHHDDDLVMYNTETVTLNDALTLARIDKPARGKNCNHRSCFDLNIYIEYSHKSKIWNCPICDKPLKFDDLVIDETLTHIVKEVDDYYDKIQLNEDGTYFLIDPITKKRISPLAISEGASTQKQEAVQNPNPIVEHNIDDEEEETDDENASTQDLNDELFGTIDNDVETDSNSSMMNDDYFEQNFRNFDPIYSTNDYQPMNNQDDPIIID